MRTRVIQREPGQPKEKDQVDPAAEPTPRANPSRRTGRWSTRHRKTAIVLLLAGLVLTGAFLASRPGASDATAAGAPTGASDFAAIDRFVEVEMDAQRIPGVALGIVEGDRIVHMRGFGEAPLRRVRCRCSLDPRLRSGGGAFYHF